MLRFFWNTWVTLRRPRGPNHRQAGFTWGDTAIMYNDGKVEVIGRKTEIIKRATVKIFPADIEKVLFAAPTS